ncbi:hypothetical protein Pcinc_006161, partial [Petrolisthes cinctipes]
MGGYSYMLDTRAESRVVDKLHVVDGTTPLSPSSTIQHRHQRVGGDWRRCGMN